MSELIGTSAPAYFNVRLSPEADARLGELADQAGMKKATLARMLLEELVPTITSVRTRLQVTRNGAKPDAG